MKLYSYLFIFLIISSYRIQANPLLLAGRTFMRAARSGMQGFRSELSKEQSSIHIPEVKPSESQASIINIHQTDSQVRVQQVLDFANQAHKPVTINIIDAKHNRGNIGSTLIKASASTKKTEQKFDHSFNQETKENASSKTKYHEGHLVGVCAATLMIAEIAHYMAG